MTGIDHSAFSFQVPQVFEVNKILFIGDLHVSDKYSPRHVNYLESCWRILAKITDMIRDKGITHIILTGDLVGRTTEKNFKDNVVRMEFHKILLLWQSLTNGNVYSVKGNHDMGSKLTDFEYFEGVGALKRFTTMDIGSVRLHSLDYGDHERQLEISENHFNVAIMHSHLTVEGKTGWLPRSNEEIELATLSNLSGVDLIVCGHIHTPSQNIVQTYINGKEIALYYPGSPTRPIYDRNVWETCFFIELQATEETSDLITHPIELEPKDVFFKKTMYDKEEKDESEDDMSLVGIAPNVESLSSILREIGTMNVLEDASYRNEVRLLAGLDVDASNLALSIFDDVERVLVK